MKEAFIINGVRVGLPTFRNNNIRVTEINWQYLNMSLNSKYHELCYSRRIHEFSKIDEFKKWPSGKARQTYKSIDEFYQKELEVNNDELKKIKNSFRRFNILYKRYFNDQRKNLFSDPKKFLQWYDEQGLTCNYCKISQAELHKIVEKRNGNLTLNQKTKRSKGTMEIEKLNPNGEYTFENSILSCPFCNNAKSNLISESDWRDFFAEVTRKYLDKLLSE